jgi:Leucine-rich repeat (LRR) protein
LTFEVLTELARTVLETPLHEDIKQLAAEESYFGYCKLSDNLMLQAFGPLWVDWFGANKRLKRSKQYGRQPDSSFPTPETIRQALKGKRHLLLVENLHVPMSLDVLVLILGYRRPSILQNWRWLISTNSNDVCEKSRGDKNHRVGVALHLTPEYYYAPPLDDLRERDWAVLIKEALQDAARSIYMALQNKGSHVDFWLHVAQQCLYYGILYHPLQGRAAGHQACNTSSITSDELVRCWVAENLIFSTAISTNTLAATNQKQINYYRSAYEAGKVVIQALQEYSLLPVYSVSLSSSQDIVTGVSKLAEDVPLLKQDDLDTHVKSNKLKRWVSFMNEGGRHVSWDWEPREIRKDTKMSTLILRGCSNMSGLHLDQLLTPHLCVLDLSYTPITSLPPSFSSLLNLYLLSLRGCSQLETLSPPPNSDKKTSPLAHLENLEVLDMNGVPLIELTQQDGSNKSSLHYLDLSGSKFTTLPSELFCEMSSLEELIFGNCTNLRELPSSMAQLLNLLVLHVEGTQITSFPEDMFKVMQSLHTLKLINNIKLMSLPRSLSKAKCMRELHISNCVGLILESLWELVPCLEDLHIQTWKSLENIKIQGHPTLRTFSLSGPWIRCLSLCGCRKLKLINFSEDLTALENVDLSRTDLEEVHPNLPNLPQLRMLLLHGVPYSMRFPWHQLVRFPKIFYLDNCSDDDNHVFKLFCQKKLCADGDHQEGEKTTNTTQININDPRMFHSFNEDAANKLVKEGQFLQSFDVQVKPCSAKGKGPLNYEVERIARIQMHSTYGDVVQYSEAASIIPMMKVRPKQRHVEISTVNQYPNGLGHILSVTNSILITDDGFVKCLTDLNYNFKDLEACQLQRCHQMTVVFLMHSQWEIGSVDLPHLQILHAFDLKNLLSVVEPCDSWFLDLKLLKHIHLEHCPRLEKMFPCSLSLPALETLVILFCSNLKTIFYKQSHPSFEVAPSPLPNIKEIYLQELPQLLHFHDDVTFQFETSNWEKLFVRGCRSFQHLPLLKKEYPRSKVEVSGECEWWNRLQLKLPEQSDYYMQVAPPEFASRKKHIIESYLR